MVKNAFHSIKSYSIINGFAKAGYIDQVEIENNEKSIIDKMRKGVNKTFEKYDDFDPDYFLDWLSQY